jgi:hypothetical protein
MRSNRQESGSRARGREASGNGSETSSRCPPGAASPKAGSFVNTAALNRHHNLRAEVRLIRRRRAIQFGTYYHGPLLRDA